MKKYVLMFLMAMVCSMGAMAQSAADKIVGTYKAVQDGQESKVKIFKYNDGYRAQVIWLKEPNNADGTPKTDHRNPDKAKQKTLSSQVVLIDKVTYADNIWKNGKIYDPTSGKTYKVEIKFKDAKTLEVKGKLGPFSQKVYWTKLS